MTNLLILYNPYYQDTVIESHLEVLKQKGKVAFGKVRSKLKDTLGSQKSQSENPLGLATIKSELHSQKAQDKRAYLQLFLTDYANLYVAKVDEILDKSQAPNEIIPNYYQQKGLNVEEYFIITDLREIVRDDFATLRDKYLANFTTPAFANHTYALYGNAYTYPIEVVQKREVCYFEGDERHFLTLFKSEAFLAQKQILTDYIFGDYLYALHPDSFENLIFAEMEFHANKNDKLYDFSGVILRYAKAFESECYEFVREIVRILGARDSAILELKFGVGSKMKEVANLSHEKAMLGAYLHLLDNLLRKSIKAHLSTEVSAFCARFTKDIAFMQKARNPVAHSDFARFEMANAVRDKIIGVGQSSVMVEMLKAKELLK
ncbi:HP0729 family protein [Helicobacter sp. 23-1046]